MQNISRIGRTDGSSDSEVLKGITAKRTLERIKRNIEERMKDIDWNTPKTGETTIKTLPLQLVKVEFRARPIEGPVKIDR